MSSGLSELSMHQARIAYGCASLVILLGVATFCVGVPSAFTIGMISLAAASVLARPISIAILLLHVAAALVALVPALRRHRGARGLAWLALVLNGAGIALAALCAWLLPGVFERLLDAAADGAAFVH